MPFPDGTEPVDEDEILYRRIPVSMGWYVDGRLSPEAFDPRPVDTTGISVYRAKYISIEDAAKGMSKKGYYIAVFRARDLIQNGIRISPSPEGGPGHAELPDLRCDNRLSDRALEMKVHLSRIWERVDGPFPTEE